MWSGAQAYFEEGKNIEALRLLDVARSQGNESVSGLELRAAVYEALLAESRHSHGNVSLDDILAAALQATQAQIKAR